MKISSCKSSCVVLLFYTTQKVYTKFGTASYRQKGGPKEALTLSPRPSFHLTTTTAVCKTIASAIFLKSLQCRVRSRILSVFGIGASDNNCRRNIPRLPQPHSGHGVCVRECPFHLLSNRADLNADLHGVLNHSEKGLYEPHSFCGMAGRIEGVPGMS